MRSDCIGRRSLRLRFIAALVFGLLQGLQSWADDAGETNAIHAPLLTVDRLFDGEEFREESVPEIVWSRHQSGYFTLARPRAGGGGRDLIRCDAATGRTNVILPAHALTPPGEPGPLSIERFELSGDESRVLLFTNARRVWRENSRGDYWVADVTSRELTRLGGDAPPSSLSFAKFSPDGRHVAYVRDRNLYVEDLAEGRITALTASEIPTQINGTFDWVYEEEFQLRDGFRWSPDGHAIAYWQLDTSGVAEFPLVDHTAGLYPRLTHFPYPKTGSRNAAARIGVVSASGGETRWLSIPGDPREHYPAAMNWASNSTEVLIQQFNRVQNTNRVLLANAATGAPRLILEETDAAWLESENPVLWFDAGRQFVWLSERDGWRHAYRVHRDGGRAEQITRGAFDVMAIEGVDDAGGWLYFAASPDRPAERYLYRVRLDGGEVTRLTPADQAGTHRYVLSPEARWAIHTFSTFTRPPVTGVVRLPDHESLRILEDNSTLREKTEALVRPAAEFFQVGIGDGTVLDGWVLKPHDFDPSRRYPVLFYVYGEPWGQTVRDAWPGRTGLWHWMLTQQGYVVMSVDNRGTPAPRGRDWRKIVHRQIGILAPSDQAEAVRSLLRRWDWMDPQRIGIWGWSGGGSMTLNALFQHPEVYRMGMAVASVPNQRLYDTIYQERYMGLPATNPEGYRLGSPLSHAHQLQGDLLLVHGTGDDNVHYQGMEALINELVAHNKPFSMMAYPNRSHSIAEGHNTRRHLFHLLTRYLHGHLPAGGTQP
ncbi:MAG: S9 family peptidase [Verrucomicrobiae bacterium]|nr:S9 family peptidase [Verrucomicrobiae bacterium]